MSAIQLGTLCFLLLCARYWPLDGKVPLTALLWRSAACASVTLLLTAICSALLLQPLALLPLQWLVGAAVAGITATVGVGGTRTDGRRNAGHEAPRSSRAPAVAWPILVAAGMLPLLAALGDPFALDAVDPRVLDMLERGGRSIVAMLVALAAFGGLCNRAIGAGVSRSTQRSTGSMRIAMVAVLALPIIGFAPWLT